MPAQDRAKTPPRKSPAAGDSAAHQDNVKGDAAKRSLFGLPPVLTSDGLEHVATHKYKPGKYTPLDNLLNPFWLRLAESLPMWLAPNLVTMLGFIPMMFSFFLAWIYAPHFSEPPPRWLALLTSLTTFLYQTLDALDGKQARRTNSSTPLGQLFDHGCDCLACLPIHSVAAMLLMPGAALCTVAGLTSLQTGFFFAQWQEYHTGVLRTSFGPVGVTETQFMLIGSAFIGFLVGPDALRAWSTSSVWAFWSSEPQPRGKVIISLWAVFVTVLVAISITKTLNSVRVSAREKGKAVGPAIVDALKHLLPITAINVSLVVLWDSAVVLEIPRKLCFLSGLLFFYYTAQIILFSMSKMKFSHLQLETLPAYLGLAAASRFLPLAIMSSIMSLAALVLAGWVLLWLYRVLDELKGKLGIRTFRIKTKTQDKSQ